MQEDKNPDAQKEQEWQAQIHRLEEELSAVALAFEKKAKDLHALRQEYQNLQARLSILETDNHRWQDDYESLRIQKGGFGFKALAGTGFAATLVGLLAGFLFFRPKDPNSVLFDHFNKSAGFRLEYAISQRQYPAAERIISEFNHNAVFSPLKPEFDLFMRLINASRTATSDSNTRPAVMDTSLNQNTNQ